MWERRQVCSEEQLGEDLYADSGAWESFVPVMTQVRRSVSSSGGAHGGAGPGSWGGEQAPAGQELSWLCPSAEGSRSDVWLFGETFRYSLAI